MFKNYLKIAFRNIRRYKGYSFVNILGLAIGMACCILIFMWVRSELSYDRYHSDAHTIYRVVTRQEGNIYQGTDKWSVTPGLLAPTLKQDFPEVIKAARITRRSGVIAHNNKVFRETRFFCADPDFLDIFTFPLILGNPAAARRAMTEPFTVLITADMAEKYFGDQDPIGKTLSLNNKHNFIVKGVLENVPENSHFKFDFLASFKTMNTLHRKGEKGVNRWDSLDFVTYIKLQDHFNPDGLEKKFPAFEKKYQGEEGSNHFSLQPLTSIHLHSNLNFELEANGDVRYVYLFSAIAFFIILIACFNYMNLATARSAVRAKEVGMRKVVGANKKDIIKQFLGESVLLSVAAWGLCIILVELILPVFRSFTGKELDLFSTNGWNMFLYSIGLTILVGMTAGLYPSLFLSSFLPIKILKGKSLTGSKDASAFRNSLVLVQFTISITLLICTIVIGNQLTFMGKRNLGYKKEQVLNVIVRDKNSRKNYENLKYKLLQHPQVTGVTASRILPTYIGGGGYGTQWEGKKKGERIIFYRSHVNYDFIDFYGMELVKGRNFSREFRTDENEAVILNETAVKELGWGKPIGKKLDKGVVIGVVKDFHYQPLHHKIEPLWMKLSTTENRYVSIKIRSGDITGTLSLLEREFKKFSPGYPFEYSFLDDRVDQMYRSERMLGRIFNYFTFLAIFISCLGLFGLASFMVERRTKEVGIRKVLGASISNVTLMLSKEFTRSIILANIIAWPIAYAAMNRWLQNFAYRTDIGIGIFIFAGLMTLAIAWLTVGYQSVKAALANPVEALRYE